MGVLDDAIREHLELKRQRGASPAEIARAEAEALGPPRHSTVFDDDADGPLDAALDRRSDDEAEHHAVATRVIEPMEDVAPPPARPSPTRAVHDIDEELAPPPPVQRERVETVDGSGAEEGAVDEEGVVGAAAEAADDDAEKAADEQIALHKDVPEDAARDEPSASEQVAHEEPAAESAHEAAEEDADAHEVAEDDLEQEAITVVRSALAASDAPAEPKPAAEVAKDEPAADEPAAEAEEDEPAEATTDTKVSTEPAEDAPTAVQPRPPAPPPPAPAKPPPPAPSKSTPDTPARRAWTGVREAARSLASRRAGRR